MRLLPTRDDGGFEDFARREMPRLRALAFSLTGNSADAEDLVQETLAKVLVSWAKVNASGSPSAYVRSIMVNHFISGKRRRASTEIVSDTLPETTLVLDPMAQVLDQHEVLHLLTQLPPRSRAVVVLRYLEDLSFAQIAQVLEIRETTARATCHRALCTLREKSSDTAPN